MVKISGIYLMWSIHLPLYMLFHNTLSHCGLGLHLAGANKSWKMLAVWCVSVSWNLETALCISTWKAPEGDNQGQRQTNPAELLQLKTCQMTWQVCYVTPFTLAESIQRSSSLSRVSSKIVGGCFKTLSYLCMISKSAKRKKGFPKWKQAEGRAILSDYHYSITS